MAYDLKIQTVGMCFFVPDPAARRMYLLMPATGGHPQHHVRVRYAARHADPSADPKAMREHDLAGLELDLSHLDAGSAEVKLPAGVADLGEVAGVKVDPRLLGATPGAAVAARVRLPSGAAATPEVGGKWTFPGKAPEMLTNRVKLELAQSADTLELRFRPLAAGVEPPPVVLRPLGGVVALEVTYLPHPDDEPDEPALGDPAPHFDCHYVLFENFGLRPVPILAEKLQVGLPGGSPYTCLTAGGPPGP